MILASAITVITFQSCAQKGAKETPEKVKTAFAKKFPNATKVEWDKENETEWEAEFKLEGKEYSANFTTDGIWKETEFEIESSEIPVAVKKTLDSDFSDYEIEEAEMSETEKGIVYEFELEKGETEIEVAIDAEGNVVKKEVKEDEDDNED